MGEKNKFVLGTVVGGVVGTIAALLLAPKSGSDFRQDISDTCCDLSESAMDRMPLLKKQEAPNNQNMVLGGIAGGVLGALTALLLAPKTGKKMRKEMLNAAQQFGEQAWNLVDNGKDALSDLANGIQGTTRKKKRR